MIEVEVPFKRWHLLFPLPRLILFVSVIANLGCDLIACVALDPVCYELFKVLLLERYWKAHLNVVRAVLVELIHPDAPVRVWRAVIREPIEPLVPYHREELQDEHEDHEYPAHLETDRLHHNLVTPTLL